MDDILKRIQAGSPNERSHDLHCRLIDAAEEIATLRDQLAAMTQLYVDESNAAAEEIARLRAKVESLSAELANERNLTHD